MTEAAARRLLITGGSGHLGAQLRQAARGWELRATYFAHPLQPAQGTAQALDLRDEAAVRAALDEFQPEAILHTACSNRSAADIQAILPAARHLARWAGEHGARLVHVSTDLVFDGEHAPYADEAPPAPLNDYGRAKAEAEALVIALCPDALLARPSLIWGLTPLDHQTRWLVEGARAGRPITLFTDEYRCPVHIHDLAAALLELAERRELTGPLNLGGPQRLSRWEFGQRLLAALHLPIPANVTPGLVADSGLVRARDLTLQTARAQRELTRPPRGVDEILKQGR